VSAAKRILGALLALENSSGSKDVPRDKVSKLSFVTKAQTFANTLVNLKKKGLIECPDAKTIRLTQKGREQADPNDVPTVDNTDIQKVLKEKFCKGGKAALLFDALLDGRVHDRNELASAAGITAKQTMANSLCKMKKDGLLEMPDRSTVRMSDMCFPTGRPVESEDV